MKVFLLGCVGCASLFLLYGCGNSGTKASDVNREIKEIQKQLVEIANEQAQLTKTVNVLKEVRDAGENDLGRIQESVEQIKKSLGLNENACSELRKTVDRLQDSYGSLSKKVGELLALPQYKALDDTRGGAARRPIGETRETAIIGNGRRGSESKRPTAEVCEAIDEYLRQIAITMRSKQDPSNANKMDTALAQLKLVLNKFKDRKDTAKISLLAEELKWKADNALKSRAILLGNPEWLQRFNEERTTLMSFCSEQ